MIGTAVGLLVGGAAESAAVRHENRQNADYQYAAPAPTGAVAAEPPPVTSGYTPPPAAPTPTPGSAPQYYQPAIPDAPTVPDAPRVPDAPTTFQGKQRRAGH
jgi:hypothetical protein